MSITTRMTLKSEIEVILHSTDPSAVSATRATIEMLPGGYLREEGGRYYVPDGFIALAVERQGYVRAVVR